MTPVRVENWLPDCAGAWMARWEAPVATQFDLDLPVLGSNSMCFSAKKCCIDTFPIIIELQVHIYYTIFVVN